MTEQTHPIVNFTDADLKLALQRALRTCAALAIVMAGMFEFINGWRPAFFSLAGAVVSLTGLYEWQKLIEFVNARLDKQKPPRSTARVIGMFTLRLGFAAGVVYVSLKCSHGKPYALLAGLGLAVVALTIEAVRLLRSE